MADKRDYYEVLGVDKNIVIAKVKAEYYISATPPLQIYKKRSTNVLPFNSISVFINSVR